MEVLDICNGVEEVGPWAYPCSCKWRGCSPLPLVDILQVKNYKQHKENIKLHTYYPGNHSNGKYRDHKIQKTFTGPHSQFLTRINVPNS